MEPLELNPVKTIKKLTEFVGDEVKKRGFSKTIVGLSGGLDSAVVSYLAVRALGAENVRGVFLPYGKMLLTDLTLARLVADNLKIKAAEFDISPVVDQFCRMVDTDKDRVARGNIMARVRMIFLYHLSRDHNSLVLGTSNKSERMLGYCTLWGDMACAIAPLGSLYKTQILQIAGFLGVPQLIIKKQPSAGFWEGQTDEDELGVTYREADRLLYFMIDKKYNFNQLRREGFQSGFIYRVKSMLAQSEFKREMPAIPNF